MMWQRLMSKKWKWKMCASVLIVLDMPNVWMRPHLGVSVTTQRKNLPKSLWWKVPTNCACLPIKEICIRSNATRSRAARCVIREHWSTICAKWQTTKMPFCISVLSSYLNPCSSSRQRVVLWNWFPGRNSKPIVCRWRRQSWMKAMKSAVWRHYRQQISWLAERK